MTAEEIARLRELLDKATPGPWRWQMTEEEVLVGPDQVVMRQDDDGMHFAYYGDGTDVANAALIAESRNALPALLNALEAAEAARVAAEAERAKSFQARAALEGAKP